MTELHIYSDIWTFHPHTPIVITTNGVVGVKGAVMGRGLAKQAKDRYPSLPMELGHLLKKFGNDVYWHPRYKLFTFPVKHHWRDEADINLIGRSCRQLVELVDHLRFKRVYLTHVGCGNGKLEWGAVRPIVGGLLYDDRFIVVNDGK